MPKHGFLTPKAISNRIKAKGLQKLKWYCQMCQKQCRDDNGFKCHIASESHRRQMSLFSENSKKFMSEFSRDFLKGYLDILRRQFGGKRMHCNVVYQEYIKDKQHIHMNSTQWQTLTGLVMWLGKKGICKIDETERGWFLEYINRDPEEMARQQKKIKLEITESAAERKTFEKALQLARQREAAVTEGGGAETQQDDEAVELENRRKREFHREYEYEVDETDLASAAHHNGGDVDDDGTQTQPHKEEEGEAAMSMKMTLAPKKIKLEGINAGAMKQLSRAAQLNSNLLPPGSHNPLKLDAQQAQLELETASNLSSTSSFSHRRTGGGSGGASDTLAAIIAEEHRRRERRNRRASWLHPGIVVQVVDDDLPEPLRRVKAVITKVEPQQQQELDDERDCFATIRPIIGSSSANEKPRKLRIHQSKLLTVIPKLGGEVLMVNGAHRGSRAKLLRVNEAPPLSSSASNPTCKVELTSGPFLGETLNDAAFDDVCELAAI